MNEPGKCQLCPRTGPGGWGVSDATTTITRSGEEIPVCEECRGNAETIEFWEFLTEGKSLDGYAPPGWKPLSPRRAMAIMYVVQECLGALPDHWELCVDCKQLFNTDAEGYLSTRRGTLCESCGYAYGGNCPVCGEAFPWSRLVEHYGGYCCKRCKREAGRK